MSEEININYVDMCHVRDRLHDAQQRRGKLEYAQVLALQHAEWFSSEMRMGYKTTPESYASIFDHCIANEKIAKYPELAGKIAEILPLDNDALRAILGTRRVALETEEMDTIIDLVKQQIGFE